MQPHVQQTLADIDTRIISLQNLRTQVVTFFADDPIPAVVPIQTHARPSSAATKAPAPNGTRKKLDHKTIKAVAKFKSLPEQFTAAAMTAASIADSTVYRYMDLGWLKRVDRNTYTRTSKMPKVDDQVATQTPPAPKAPKPARAVKPGADSNAKYMAMTKEKLESEIIDTIKLRDTNRANGNETLAAIYQRKVDDMQSELDERV